MQPPSLTGREGQRRGCLESPSRATIAGAALAMRNNGARARSEKCIFRILLFRDC